MTSSKRFLARMLCLIVVGLFAGTPAVAAERGGATFSPCADEPDASGKARLNATLATWTSPTEGTLSVSCAGLTPGATYAVSMVGAYASDEAGIASASGRLMIKSYFRSLSSYLPTYIHIDRQQPDGTWIVVLAGTIVWR